MRHTQLKYLVIIILLASFIAGVWYFKHRQSSGVVEGEDPNQPFVVVNAADRGFEGVPSLALTFSLPLDTGKTVDKYIQVFEMPDVLKKSSAEDSNNDENTEGNTPGSTVVSTKESDTNFSGGKLVSSAWVVGDNPRILYFPNIKPQTRYIVQVQAGLPSKNGKTLASEVRYSILTAQVSPAYYFASNGMVLPAKQNGGLPVVTVNVPEVDVQFLKVKEDQLPRFLDRVINGKKRGTQSNSEDGEASNDDWKRSNLHGAVQNYQLDDLHKLTDSVYEGRFVTEQTQNKRSVTFLPVEEIKELKEPGVYVAVMNQPNRFSSEYQTTYFYVSDIGLHTHLYPKSADVFVSSLSDGKAVKDVEISWLDEQGKVLARVETDSDGHAVFPEQPKQAKVILAKKDKQISMLALKEPALDLSEFTVTGDPYKPVRLFAYSGRNLYRPGENFDVSVVARDADGHGVSPQPIQAKLKGPDGREQFNATWKPDVRYSGYFLQRISLSADAATGTWTLELRVDPADKIPSTIFKFGVEEFLPERMKLELASKQTVLKPGEKYTIDVVGTYLYGAPAAGNRLLGVVQFERDVNPLSKQYPGFEFGDVNETEKKTRKELEEHTLNDEGKASVEIDLSPADNRHSPYSVRTTLSLLESGGRPVVRSIEKVIWPAPVLVGVRPLFNGGYAPENSPVDFEVIRVDSAGKLQASAPMPVRLFREDRNYYWRFADDGGWQSGFTETDELVATNSVAITADARATLRLPVKYGRYRLEILDPATNQTLVYRFYAGWNAQDNEAQGNRPDRVALKLDKAAYKNGDTAQLTITPPHDGEALVMVEGDHVQWLKRVPVSAKGSTVSIPIEEDWKRHDLYISAVVFRPGNQGKQVTPARALGIIYLPLDRADRKLDVSIEAPAKIKPDTDVKIKVKVQNVNDAAKNQKAFVTLSAVDVGILNITQFATPDPFEFFFGRLRYGADIYDIYGRLIEKMAGQKGKLKFGGDNTPKPGKNLPKKVLLVDLFSGPVLLNEKGEADITLNVPDFNGTLRLMAVVNGADHFGSKDQEMVVAAPLVAEIATPRFLSLGDKALIALDLTNLSGVAQQFTLNLDGGDGLKIGEGQQTVSLKDQQKTTLRFPLEPRGALGLQEMDLKIVGTDLKLERHFTLMVQAPTQQQQLKKRYLVKPNDTLDIKDAELSGLYPSSVMAHMLVSNKAPIDIRAAVQGLLEYPYGCAEQTTSTAYPHIFIDETLAKKFGLKVFTREQRVAIIDKAISRIAAMQAPNGGFSLWGNVAAVEYWLSAYVTNFLVDAREQGFAVPDALFNKAMDYLLRGLQEGVSRLPTKPKTDSLLKNDDDARFTAMAFGGYVLSRINKAPLSTLRQLHESRFLASSGLPLVQLGIAQKQMGDDERSKIDLAAGLELPRKSGYWWYDYGSALRDNALIYSLLQQYQIKLAGSENLLAIISSDMDNHLYYSTQEKFALFQAGRYLTVQTGEPWSASLNMNGKSENLAGGGKTESDVFRELTTKNLTTGLKLKNNFNQNLWVELALTGNPIKLLPPKDDIIKLTRTMYTPDGKLIANRPLKVGETVIMHIKVTANAEIGNGMVVDRIPAGLEIENSNIVQGEQMNAVKFDGIDPSEAMKDPRIKHVEFRDDRFVTAAKLDNTILNLFYRMRVVTPGKFVVPPLYADDMYRPDVYGSSGGGDWLTIVE